MPQIDLVTFFNLLFSLFLFFSLIYFFDAKVFSIFTNFAVGNETSNSATKHESFVFFNTLIIFFSQSINDSKI